MGMERAGGALGDHQALASGGASTAAGRRVANIDDDAVFAAIAYVPVSGCPWRALPPCFGASKPMMHRRFLIWSRAGVWGRFHQKVLEILARQGLIDQSRAVLESASRVPRCTSRRTRTDCPYASAALRPPTTASG